MKILEKQFRKNGFDFKQLRREGDVVLLSKTKPHYTKTFYEVAIVQKHNGYSLEGKFIPASECIPSSEQWGNYGWAYSDLELAKQKFDKLVAAS